MPLFNFVRWLRSLSRRRGTMHYRKPRTRLHLETLEERLTPAPYTWTGAGGDNRWTTAGNWSLGVAPTGTAATMDDLTFGPQGVSLLTTRNDFTNGVFNSITFSDDGYTIIGNKITLGDPLAANSGHIIVNSNASGEIISANIQLAGTTQQFMTVNSGGDLLISGKLTGTSGSSITKNGIGTGLLVLANDNSGFTGAINVNSGILQITNAKALGDTSNITIVAPNAQLQISNVSGDINESVLVSGPGIANDGVILNVAGNNTWAGDIQMDTHSIFGSTAGKLTVTGVIGDQGASVGYNLTKEGAGQITLANVNTYRGETIINNGILEISAGSVFDPISGLWQSALGSADGTAGTGTTVNKNLVKTGMLQISSLLGLTVVNERLTLNNFGVGGLGSLYNVSGDSIWTGNVIIGSSPPDGSPVSIGANAGSSILVSGVVQDPNGIFSLTKVGLGTLIFTNANTYRGFTTVAAGILNIRDSRGLGATSAGTAVLNAATLALEVDNLVDSITGNATSLRISDPLTINGFGVNNQGALNSISGLNEYLVDIALVSNPPGTVLQAAIGVQPDTRIGHPTATNSYFTNDFHLIADSISGSAAIEFDKFGTGHLILPNANTYQGNTHINEGWVTIQNNDSLGPQLANTPPTKQPITKVALGAALHLKPLTPGLNLDIKNNLDLAGLGVTHAFGLIDEKGVVVSLGGRNTLSGNIAVAGQVGLGVQQVDPSQDPVNPSELTTTGTIFEAIPNVINVNFTASGFDAEERFPIDTGAKSGTIIVDYDFRSIPDDLRIYYDGNLIFDTGLVSGAAITPPIPYGPGTSTFVELVMNEGGGDPNTFWVINNVQIIPNANTAVGGITKLGQRRLNIQGDGTYQGDVIVAEGSLRAQHDTALGTTAAQTTTTVMAGATLELAAGLAANNGGISAGIQVWNEHLILNGAGNTYFGTAPLVNQNGMDLAGNAMAGDNMVRGPVTLNTFGTTYNVTFQGTLAGVNQPQMIADDTNLTGTNASAVVTTPTQGNPGNEVQTITFAGDVTGGTFTLTFNSVTTGAIAYSANASTLAHNIQAALDKLATIGMGNSVAANTNATIDVRKGTRLNIFGVMDDVPNGDVNGSDLNIIASDGGSPYPGVPGAGATGPSEIALEGVNTYRGTTFVNQNVVVILESNQGLGATGTGSVQTVSLSGLTTGTFTLGFNGATTPTALAFNATAAQVQTALNNLATIGGSTVGGSVGVTRVGNVFTITFGGNLASFHQSLIVATGLGGTIAGVAQTSAGAGGTIVSDGAAIELQGNITVAGEPVIIQGQGVATDPNIPFRWFQQGPAPTIDNSQTPGDFSTTGRVTGVAVDPRDRNVIYVSTAGGGGWKTTNGGVTWRPLFDNAGASPIPMFTGAIAISSTNPNVLYLGTGEANNSADSYYGTGVYKSSNAGLTWTPVLGPAGPNANPLNGRVVSKIVVDPVSQNTIYVAVSDVATGATPGNAGIWRYNGSSWTNLTAIISVPRADFLNGGPGTPGPNDNFNTVFYQTNATYSDLAVMQDTDPFNPNNRFIVFAQGTASGGTANNFGSYGGVSPSFSNAVFVSLNNGTSFREVMGTVNFPTTQQVNVGGILYNFPFAGNIKLAQGNNGVPFSYASQTAPTYNIFAAVTYPPNGANGAGQGNTLRDIYTSTISYDFTNFLWVTGSWGTTTKPPNYLQFDGAFASTVFVNPSDFNDVIVAGTGTAKGENIVLQSTDAGGTWADISVDNGNAGPHAGVHAITSDPNGRVLFGTDGGIYRRDPAGTPVWNDLNGNLAITQFNGVAVDPSDPNSAFGGSRSNGVAEFAGNFPWTFADDKLPAGYTLSAGQVRIDPNNPNNVYAVEANGAVQYVRRSTNGGTNWSTIFSVLPVFNISFQNGWGSFNVDQLGFINSLTGTAPSISLGTLVQGGATQDEIQTLTFGGVITGGFFQLTYTGGFISGPIFWPIPFDLSILAGNIEVALDSFFGYDNTAVFTGANALPTLALELDSVNSNRLLLGTQTSNALFESVNNGTTWTSLGNPSGTAAGVRLLAAAAYQGNFVADAGFPLVDDVGTNTYDPNTIYAVSRNTALSRSTVYLTKNRGTTWVNRSGGGTVAIPLPASLTIADIIVDPRNRDTAYVVSSATRGTPSLPSDGRVFVTTDAGINWTDITGSGISGLPDVAAWTIALDSRTGNLYVGNDLGVYVSANGGSSWKRLGTGLPYVQVKDLVLNQALNTLSAGTYGRSMYTFWLNETRVNAGVLSSVSGSAVWSGAVIMAGNTVISAKGTQNLQSSTASASLNIVGTISDSTPNGNFKLDKIGFGDVILSGGNVYGGATEIKEGVVVARNSQALGASTAGTTVNLNTALELESSINGEPLFLNGDGVPFNDHYTGALRNTVNNNTYTGPIILQSFDPSRLPDPDVFVPNGVVTIGADTGTTLTITNSITDTDALTDLTQGLSVTKEGTGTVVYAQGITFNVRFQSTLGNSVQPTMIANGAGLTGNGIVDGSRVSALPTVSVATVIPGSATPNTNAVQTISFGGNLTTGGTFTLEYNGQTTNPITWVEDAAVLEADILAKLEALTNIDVGDVAVLANRYTGGTFVNQGVLQLKNGMGLGSTASAITSVRDGGALQFMGTLEVQTITVTGNGGTFNVEFNGQTATGIAFNATAATLQTALNNLPTIGLIGGSVSVTKSSNTFTITFRGTQSAVDVPQLDATRIGGFPGSAATEATLVHGSGSIVVPASQVLALSGTGSVNTGALVSTNGSHTWSGSVTLQRLASFSPSSNPTTIVAIGATNVADTLTIADFIEDDALDVVAFGIIKVGAGKAILQGTNTYTGATTVNTGILTIQNVQALGLPGGAGTTVNSGAMLQLDLGAGGTVTGEGLTLNGSGISNSGALQNLTGITTWTGGVTLATSSTINVPFGSLTVNGIIAGAAGLTLTKRGANTLTVTNASNTFSGTTSIVQGTVLVNGKLAAISLAGGTLGGSGTVGAVTSTATGGIVAPGSSPGTLNTGAIVWNSATTYSVELNGTGAGQFDKISATGTVNLGNANLSGTVGYSPTVTNSFVIITATGNISGAFAQGGNGAFVFISGYKFRIDIDNTGAAKTVTLVHFASDTTTTVATSKTPSVYGENVTWTATVTSEQGGPASGTVNFIVDGTTTVPGGPYTLAGGIATFQTSALVTQLIVGLHPVSVNFTSGSGSFNPSSGTLAGGGQSINKANTLTTVSSSTAGSSVFGETVFFTATVGATLPGTGTPTGNVEFRIDGNLVSGTFTLSGGTVVSPAVSNLTVSGSPHSVSVNYLGSGNFIISNGTLVGGQTVGKGNSSVAVSSSTGGTSVFGQPVTFTATVSAVGPAVGTPGGNVQFVVDGSTLAPVALASGMATFPTSSLAVSGTPHTVQVNYLGNGNFNPNNGSLVGGQTVNKANSSVAVSSSTGGTSVVGQTVIFTVTVSAVGPGAGTPGGNVEFVVDGGTLAPTALAGGMATFSTSTLGIAGSPHSVTVNYLGSGNFNTNNGSLVGGQTVTQANSSVAVSSSTALNTSVFGQSVTFTVTVGAASPASGTPAGNIEFVIDGATLAPVALSVGMATTSTAGLAVSGPIHTVTVNYLGSTDFAANSGALAGGQTVSRAGTSVAVSTSDSTTVFGEPVTFTGTVSAVGPGVGTPAGNVAFLANGATISPVVGVALSGGVATFSPITPLNASGTPYSITVQYLGSGDFNTSSGTLLGGQTISKAGTSVAVSTSDPTTVFGEPVTFTGTVSAVGPGVGTPTGNVAFLANGLTIAASVALSGGSATFSPITPLDASGTPYSITVQYLGSGNFNTNSGTLAGGQTISKASTSTALSTSATTAGFGEATIQATVTTTGPGTGTPTGNVTFHVTGAGTFDQTKPLASGVATFDVTALTPGTYSITAEYLGDGSPNNHLASGPTAGMAQTIVKANTSVAVSSSTALNTSVFGQAVTFTATVSTAGGGLGTPTGNAEFIIDGATVNPGGTAIDGFGKVTFSTSSLAVTPPLHTVTVNYLGDTNFNINSGSLTGGQTVNKANTSVSVTRTQSSPTAFGTTVTFTASVGAVSPGAGTVGGNVAFVIDGATVAPSVGLSGGVATYETDTLTPNLSPHSVTVNYLGSTDFITSSGTLVGGHSVSKIASSVTVSSSTGGTSVFGEPVTFTVTVGAGASPNLGTPTGNVAFVIDGATQAPTALSGGTATFSPVTPLNASVTPHTVTVNYLGSSNYSTNSGSLAGGQTVGEASTTTTLNTSNSNGVFGEEVITATVAAVPPGAGIPGSTVTFHIDDGINPISNVTVNVIAGVATLNQKLNVGTYSITADFNDASSPNFLGSTAVAIAQTVSKANTTAAVSSSTGGTSVFGQLVVFTVTVSTNAPGSGTPTGNVEFVVDGSTLAPTGLAGGKATFATSSLTIAGSPHSVSVNYLGNGNLNTSSGSLAGGQTVTQASSTVTVSSSANPSVVGQAVTFTATVSAAGPSTGTPTGTVNFLIDGSTVATGIALVAGKATFVTSALAAGTHTVQANFVPSNGNYAGNAGGVPGGQTVLAFSKVGVVLAPNKIGVNKPFSMTLTAQASNGAPVPSYNGIAKISLMAAPAGGSIVGLKNVKFVNGKLTLKGLRLTRAGTYKIKIVTGGKVIIVTIHSGGSWTYAQKQ